MKRFLYSLFVSAVLMTSAMAALVSDISPQEYRGRRAAVLAKLDSGGVLALAANESMPRNGDVSYPYRQESNFLYLTGYQFPGAYLLIVHDGIVLNGKRYTELFFPAPFNQRRFEISGGSITPDSARVCSGADTVFADSDFNAILKQVLAATKILYSSPVQPGFIEDWRTGRRIFPDRESISRLKDLYPNVTVKPATGFLSSFRLIKSPAELALMREAIRITCDGLMAVDREMHEGMAEYEAQGILEGTFIREGSEWVGFPSIIASGVNATKIHYEANRRISKPGELLLTDVGAEYHGYSADITRTIPMSGKFTEAQKVIYTIVLNAQRAAIAVIRPGVAPHEVEDAARKVINESGFGKFLTHGISHSVGLDVHDPGLFGRDAKYAPGMVITVEPGLYIPEGTPDVDPKLWNIGVRIEDDVLVTDKGAEVLTGCIPKEIDDVESIVGKR